MASILRTASRMALRGGAAGASVSASLLNEVARRLRARTEEPDETPPRWEESAPRPERTGDGPPPAKAPQRRRTAAAATTTRPAAADTPKVEDTVPKARPGGPAERPVRPSVSDRTGSNTARNAGGRITKPKAARKVRKRQEATAKTGDGRTP